MSTEETKILLHDVIENSDTKLINILYTLALEYNHQHFEYSEELLKELDVRRERHLNGESKSYSWEEVKESIIRKHKK